MESLKVQIFDVLNTEKIFYKDKLNASLPYQFLESLSDLLAHLHPKSKLFPGVQLHNLRSDFHIILVKHYT